MGMLGEERANLALLSIFKKPIFDAGCPVCIDDIHADTPRMPTSTYAEPEPPSCAVVICIFQFLLRNTEGAVDVRLREVQTRAPARPPPSHFTLVCVYHCSYVREDLQRRKFRCHGQPLPRRAIASVDAQHRYADLFRNALV